MGQRVAAVSSSISMRLSWRPATAAGSFGGTRAGTGDGQDAGASPRPREAPVIITLLASGSDATSPLNQTFVPRYVSGVGALIMLGTLGGLIAVIYGVVLRYDPEARRPPTGEDDR